MKWIGLITEVFLLALAVYIYLFSIGTVKIKNPKKAAKAEQFRKENGRWLRLLALALMAIMFVNVFFSLSALF